MREGRREEKEERNGSFPLSSALQYELRQADAGYFTEILKVVHLHHRVRDRIQDISDVEGSGDIGARGAPVPVVVLGVLHLFRALMGDSALIVKSVLKAKVVDVGALEGEISVEGFRAFAIDVSVLDFLGDLIEADGDDEELFFSVEEEGFVVIQGWAVCATVTNHDLGLFDGIFDVAHIKQGDLQTKDGGVVDCSRSVNEIRINGGIDFFSDPNDMGLIVGMQVFGIPGDLEFSKDPWVERV